MDYESVLRTDGAKEFRLPKGVTEDNWKSRMNFCSNLTDTINSYGREKLPKDFHAQIEPILNSILDCAASERTQLSNAACRLLERLPEVLEKDMHQHLDRILPVLLKLCANTKQVTVKVAAAAVSGVLQHSTYSPRMLWHICQVFDDKAAGPKIHGTGWLQAMLKDSYRSIDLNKDGRMISKAISQALEDADPTVRTKSRATYWTYSKLDPESAQEIMEKLNNHAKTALQNDPSNPDKKASNSKPQPPRPKSALADVRKEQARKKRAEEEALKQKKVLSASTASHENIEIHEPRKDRLRKDDRINVSKATSTDRMVEGWQPPQKSTTTAPTVHKKTLSQDNEIISKPSASSRLLSAPVRRPRINVTPMNAPNTNRPASRTGQNNPQIKEKEQQKDSRPTSSSSWKSASANSAVTSPKRRAVPVSPPKTRSTPATSPEVAETSAEFTPLYIPDGKENVVSNVSKDFRTEDGPAVPHLPISIPKHPERNAARKPLAPAPSLEPTPPDLTTVEHRISRREQRAMDAHHKKEMTTQDHDEEAGQLHKDVRYMSHYPEPPYEVKPVKTRDDRVDLRAAQRFLAKNISAIDSRTFDPLIFRKLKQIIEQYPQDLITDGSTYDQLFQNLCICLSSTEDLMVDRDVNHNNYTYSRTLILQISVPLLKNYRSWSQKYWSPWIESMIYYRCTLTTEECDRRIKYVWQSVTEILNDNKQPLDFIASVNLAIENGEKILLQDTSDIEAEIAEERGSRGPAPGLSELEEYTPGTTPSQYSYESHRAGSAATHASINPYSVRSNWKNIGEVNCPRYDNGQPNEDAFPVISAYMKKALNEHSIATIEHDRPYPKALPLLIDFSLQVYTKIFERAQELGDTLDNQQASQLCAIAEKCLSSYDHMMKRSIVQFLRLLYQLMGEHESRFFDYFPDENHRNLLEYYLFNNNSRP